MSFSSSSSRRACARALALACAGAASGAWALSWDLSGTSIALDTRLTTGAAIRVENQDPSLIGIANGGRAYSVNSDDGDLAFQRGDVVAWSNKLTSALTVSRGDFGIFARGNYTLDPVNTHQRYLDPADFGAGHEYGQDRRAVAERQVHDHLGSDGSILDLYAFGSVKLFNRTLTVKAGRQVVNWGETTLVLNGLNSIVALDANKARLPGAELDEIVIPAAQVYASVNLVENLSAEGWYQLKWERTIPDATGSYWETTDYIGPGGIAGNIDLGRGGEYLAAGSNCPGGNNPLTPTTCVPFGGSVPVGAPRNAKNGGQWGAALRFFVPWLNSMDAALYASNYHSRLPLFSTLSSSAINQSSQTAAVFAEYPEDIHMYGASFNVSLIGGFTLQGEYSYRPNQPLQLDDVELELATLGVPSQIEHAAGATLGGQYLRGYRRHKVSLLDFGTTKIFSPSPTFGYDELLLIGEVAAVRVHDLENPDALRYEGPGTFLPGDAATAALFGVPQQQGGFATANSAGYKLILRPTYNNVLVSGLALKPTLVWQQDLYGTTPAPLQNFVKGSRQLSPILNLSYRDVSADLGYVTYFGAGQANLLRDRDYFFFDVKYTF